MEKDQKPKVEFIPLIKDCTYHYPTKGKPCRNCNNIGKYKDGYYLVLTNKKGKKSAWFVDTIK